MVLDGCECTGCSHCESYNSGHISECGKSTPSGKNADQTMYCRGCNKAQQNNSHSNHDGFSIGGV